MILPSADEQSKTMMSSKWIIRQTLEFLGIVIFDFLNSLLIVHSFAASTRTYAGKSLYCRNFKENPLFPYISLWDAFRCCQSGLWNYDFLFMIYECGYADYYLWKRIFQGE
jgi:hypothetical protein